MACCVPCMPGLKCCVACMPGAPAHNVWFRWRLQLLQLVEVHHVTSCGTTAAIDPFGSCKLPHSSVGKCYQEQLLKHACCIEFFASHATRQPVTAVHVTSARALVTAGALVTTIRCDHCGRFAAAGEVKPCTCTGICSWTSMADVGSVHAALI